MVVVWVDVVAVVLVDIVVVVVVAVVVASKIVVLRVPPSKKVSIIMNMSVLSTP